MNKHPNAIIVPSLRELQRYNSSALTIQLFNDVTI